MSSYNIIDGVLQVYYGKATNAVIPKDVTKIGQYAFTRRPLLKSVTIPNNVKDICSFAFKYCTSLSKITISNNIEYIGICPFSYIKKVKTQYNNGKLRAFKGFNYNWTCRDFKYEIGKSYHQNGIIDCCSNGFHACTNPLDVFNYYWGNIDNFHFAEVELSGTMDFDGVDSKVAASDIRIIRELTLKELFEIYNNMEKV